MSNFRDDERSEGMTIKEKFSTPPTKEQQMKDITTKDLKESLTLCLYHQQKDGQGGWKEFWKRGPRLWAHLWPLVLKSGFHEKDEGGPMASQCGYIHTLPPPSYRLIIRAGIEIPPKSRFLWHLRSGSKHLSLVNQPVSVQYHRFLSMTVVEDKSWESS
jgi:hypothetical protein